MFAGLKHEIGLLAPLKDNIVFVLSFGNGLFVRFKEIVPPYKVLITRRDGGGGFRSPPYEG